MTARARLDADLLAALAALPAAGTAPAAASCRFLSALAAAAAGPAAPGGELSAAFDRLDDLLASASDLVENLSRRQTRQNAA